MSIDYTNQIGYNEFKMGASIENHEISYYSNPNPERITYNFGLLDTDGVPLLMQMNILQQMCPQQIGNFQP